jgi:hypothetical protein
MLLIMPPTHRHRKETLAERATGKRIRIEG